MRHRLCNLTGIGCSEEPRLDNNVKLIDKNFWDKFLADAEKSFKIIAKYGGFDYRLEDNGFYFGIEPSYQGDPFFAIGFEFSDKSNCWIEQGIATGFYGANVVSHRKVYKEYKRKAMFLDFIDKWYDKISENKNIFGDKYGKETD